MQLIVGNWKMNGTRERSRELAHGIAGAVAPHGATLVVAPPYPFLDAVSQVLHASKVALCGQNCAVEKEGAFTGEVAAEMLANVGCSWVIVGHSERRTHQGETDDLVAKKVTAGLRAGLHVIACVGERLEEREHNRHEETITRQVQAITHGRHDLDRIVLAYEPVWAIGTGHVATPQQAGAMHRHIRAVVVETISRAVADKVAIIYGGSVKPDNMESLAAVEGIDGALVGGASLEAKSFLAIAENAVKGEAKRSKHPS